MNCNDDNIMVAAFESIKENEIDEAVLSPISQNDDNESVENGGDNRASMPIINNQPKEEILNVQFIFDWIPSYLLVISKVHKPINQTPHSSPKNNEVA